MSSICPIDFKHASTSAKAEIVILSLLALTIVGIAATFLTLQTQSTLILAEKFAIPIYAAIGIATAIVIIRLVSTVIKDCMDWSPKISEEEAIKGEEPTLERIVEEASVISEPFIEENTPGVTGLRAELEPKIEEQKIQLRKKAKDRLVEVKKYATNVDWKQFALMNNTSFIMHSSLDQGHHTFSCLKAYLDYLKLLTKEGPIFNFTIAKDVIEELQETLTTAKDIMSNYPLCYDDGLDEATLKTYSDVLVNRINAELKKKGYVYFPSGYCGRMDDSVAHAVACKITWDKKTSTINFSYLNLGEGAQWHPELSATPMNIKCSYSYYPAEIPVEVWNVHGHTIISHLMRFKSDVPHEMRGYCSQDLYDVLAALNKNSMQPILNNAQMLAAKLQHVGDCAEKASRNIITDFLKVLKKISEKNVDLAFLNLHFSSIISGYYSLLAAPKDDHKELLINACEEFANFLIRAKTHLSEEEFLLAAEMIDIIIQDAKLQEAQNPSIPAPKTQVISTLHQVDFPEIASIDDIKQGKVPKPIQAHLPPFNAGTFKQDAAEFAKYFDQQTHCHVDLWETYAISLPTPQWGNDVWDSIPVTDIPEILASLRILHHYRVEGSQGMLAAFNLYAIEDKLVRRWNTPGKYDLKGHFPFPIEDTERYVFFPSIKEELQFQKIKSYFSELKKIFPDTLPFPNWDTLEAPLKLYFTSAAEGYKLSQGKRELTPQDLLKTKSWQDFDDARDHTDSFAGSKEYRLLQFCLKYKNDTTNDILCKPKTYKKVHKGKEKEKYGELICESEYKDVSKELLNELLLLLRNPKLQVGLILQWLPLHYHDLNTPLVQLFIERALFSAGALKMAFNGNPEVIDEIREQIEKGLARYNDSYENTSAILFLIRCGITLESYHAPLCGKPIDESRLDHYKGLLKEMQEKILLEGDREEEDERHVQVLTHLIFLDSFRENKKSAAEFIEVYKLLFRYQMITYGAWRTFGVPMSLRLRLDDYGAHLFKALQFFLKNQKDPQKSLDEICNGIINQIPNQSIADTWEFDPGAVTCRSKRYHLDFIKGSIRHATSGHTLVMAFKSERLEQKHKEFGIDPGLPWWCTYGSLKKNDKRDHLNCIMITFDEATMIMPTWRQPYLFKTNGVVTMNRLALFDQKALDQLPILWDNNLIHYAVRKGAQDAILSVSEHNQVPYMRMDFQPTGIRITRLDETGNALPYKLANLKELDPTHPLHAYTRRFAAHDKITCFIHETTQEIEELDFNDLHLKFKRNSQGLESQQFPGYYLLPLNVKALKSFSRDAMILRNAQGKMKVILPVPKLETKTLGFSKEIKNEIRLLGEKYYLYEIDSLDQPLKGKTVTEQLFLMYFYKSHGDYAEAYSLLKKLYTFTLDREALGVILSFFSLKDYTPLSLAFTQKLFLFVVDHLHYLQRHKEQDADKELNKEHWIDRCLMWGCHWYVNYLRAATDDVSNALPIEWRLTEEEEYRIFAVLKREKTKLPRILEVRSELIMSEERKAVLKFRPQEVRLLPHAIENVLRPNQWKKLSDLANCYGEIFGEKAVEVKQKQEKNLIAFPIQVSPTYCRHHFIELYKQACAVRGKSGEFHPFDLTLIALLRTSEHEDKDEKDMTTEARELASLLFYVRHYHNWFDASPQLSFDKCTTSDEHKEVFKRILWQMQNIFTIKQAAFEDFEKKYVRKKETFAYTETVTLELPKKKIAAPQPLPELDVLKVNRKPLESIRRSLFQLFKAPSSYGNETLFESSLIGDSPLEKAILEKYEKAHKKLAEQAKCIPKLQSHKMEQTKKDLRKKKLDFTRKAEQEKKRIQNYLNDPFRSFSGEITLAQEREFRLALNAHQTYVMTPEMVMKEAILKNSTALFDEHRPMLRREHVKTIVAAVHRYYHLLVLSSMCSEGLGILDKLNSDPGNAVLEQELFNVLNYEFTWEPEKYPEIAYMRIKTGKLPRKEQFEVHEFACEALEQKDHRLFQLSAGLGKTSYLTPLLILRAKRYKRLPFVLTTQAMYGIEKENLAKTLALLEEELATLEIGMNTKLTLKVLESIYDQLVAALYKGQTFLITPQTYYTLRLSYFTAVIHGEKQEAEKLKTILEFFTEQTFLLGDESHRNFDPMTQAIFGLGNFVTLKRKEQNLLMALVKPLFGIESLLYEGSPLSEIALSKENGKGTPGKKQMRSIQKTLANHILSSFFTGISDNKRSAILKFWLNRKEHRPAFLKDLSDEERHLILLARYFFSTLLKQVLNMKTDFDHVHSPEQGGIDTPAYYKTPSHAQFKDPYLTFILSIKGTWKRGLDQNQFRTLIESLKKIDLEEQQLAHNVDETPAQLSFKDWVSKTHPNLTLKNFDLKDKITFDQVYATCAKQEKVVVYFLTSLVLSGVGYSAEQFSSSPAHVMDGFGCSVLYSATPLAKIAYPKLLKKMKLDDLFEAKVIAQSSKAENQNFIFPKDSDGFFKHIGDNRASYAHVLHMIDAGGFLCHESNEEVAKKWLAASDLQGVIYFKGGAEAYEEKLCFMRKTTGAVIEFSHMEELKAALSKENIKLQDLTVGTFFDASHAESAHFDPKAKKAAYVFVGDDTTLSHAIQAIMRERGFLNEAINQQIIWIVQEDLKKKMQGNCKTFNSSVIHSWCLKNEAKAIKTGIVMAAFQEIIFKIEQLALKTHPDSRDSILKYTQGFKETVIPHASWASRKTLAETESVLWRFAQNFYKRFGFNTPLEDNKALLVDIGETIASVHKIIPSILTDFQKSAASEMHQKCVIKKQVRIVQFPQKCNDLKSEPVTKHPKIKDSSYPALFNQHAMSVRDIFKTPYLTENFYIETNQLETASQNGKKLKENFLKTIDFLLVVKDQQSGKIWAEAISNDMLPKYMKQLEVGINNKAIQHQAFIIRADGVKYAFGKGDLAPDEQFFKNVMRTPWMQDVMIDVALLNGKIVYNARFTERVTKWPNFLDFWYKILQALALKKEISLTALQSFLPAELAEELVN